MARLEELTPGAFLKGLLPDRLVTVVNTKWYGSTAVELTFKDAAGSPGNFLLYRDREPALEIVSAPSPWSFDADGEVLKLVSEAYRIHFAYSADLQTADSVEAGSAHEFAAAPAILNPGFVKEQLILQERLLARKATGAARERETWGTGEEAGIRGVETFFVEAINLLDGQISVREPGRYEMTQLPASLADLGRSSSFDKRDLQRYSYFTFDADKTSSPNRPAAELIFPGHPLIKATVELVLEHYQSVLRQGAILLDPGDDSDELRALFYLEHQVEEVGDCSSLNAVISRQLQCVSIDVQGRIQMAGKAPYLNYRPPGEEDMALVGALRDEPWIGADLEDKVLAFAVSQIVPRHLEQVRHRQKELTARAMAALRNRVREEIKESQDAAGQSDLPGPARCPSMDEFESQLQQHMQDLEEKRQVFPLSPVAIGGALVVPAGLLAQLKTWRGGERKEVVADAGPDNGDIEDVAQQPQAGFPGDDIEQQMPGIGAPGQEKTGDQDEPVGLRGKEIQWREIIEHIRHEEEPEALAGQEDLQELLPAQENQGDDGSALFSLVPDLVPAEDSGSEQIGRESIGKRPYGLGKKHLTGIPADLQEEWQIHAERLRELNLDIPQDTPLVKRNELDGGLALWIPSGKFFMGAKRGNKDEKPVRSVQLDGFYLDVCLVTNEQYARFVRATGLQDWKPPTGYADHPVVGVNWANAKAYCDWAGKRLPTEAEWEKGARGTDDRDYPWGKDYAIGNANALGAGYSSTAPVGIFPSGKSPYGALDMAGNVWEWVADWYDANYYLRGNSSNPKGPDRGEHRVVRGGSWICHANYLRCTKRDHHPEAYRSRFIGFRCVH